jgi:hypothetical protein
MLVSAYRRQCKDRLFSPKLSFFLLIFTIFAELGSFLFFFIVSFFLYASMKFDNPFLELIPLAFDPRTL